MNLYLELKPRKIEDKTVWLRDQVQMDNHHQPMNLQDCSSLEQQCQEVHPQVTQTIVAHHQGKEVHLAREVLHRIEAHHQVIHRTEGHHQDILKIVDHHQEEIIYLAMQTLFKSDEYIF